MISQERLKELLEYNPETGDFVWRVTTGRVKAGQVAGHKHVSGYVRIRVDKVLHHAHNLVWVYMYGAYPDPVLDHINGNGLDNTLANLRLAVNGQLDNLQNLTVNKRNTSGVTGVCIRNGRCETSITHNKKRYHIGTFATLEEAAEAHAKVKSKLHSFNPTQR